MKEPPSTSFHGNIERRGPFLRHSPCVIFFFFMGGDCFNVHLASLSSTICLFVIWPLNAPLIVLRLVHDIPPLHCEVRAFRVGVVLFFPQCICHFEWMTSSATHWPLLGELSQCLGSGKQRNGRDRLCGREERLKRVFGDEGSRSH